MMTLKTMTLRTCGRRTTVALIARTAAAILHWLTNVAAIQNVKKAEKYASCVHYIDRSIYMCAGFPRDSVENVRGERARARAVSRSKVAELARSRARARVVSHGGVKWSTGQQSRARKTHLGNNRSRTVRAAPTAGATNNTPRDAATNSCSERTRGAPARQRSVRAVKPSGAARPRRRSARSRSSPLGRARSVRHALGPLSIDRRRPPQQVA